MSETIMRYLAMLQHLPRHPGGITVTELHARLCDLDLTIDRRSVERDLNHLARTFSITCTESRPAQWHWARDAQVTMLPAFDTGSALAYELVARHLAPMMPRRTMAALEPQFKSARHVLDDLKVSPLGRWSKRIAVLSSTQALLPADVAEDVTEVVYEALLNSRRLEVSYRASGQDRAKRYPINPLGLVLQAGALYLVGTAKDYTTPFVFALHRMSNARRLKEPAVAPDDFDLDRYLRQERLFEHPHGSDIRLELRISPWLARYLDERRLAEDQRLTLIRGSDWLRLRATVADTGQLRWWLRSFGTEVEVIRPVALRREMADEFDALAKTYRSS